MLGKNVVEDVGEPAIGVDEVVPGRVTVSARREAARERRDRRRRSSHSPIFGQWRAHLTPRTGDLYVTKYETRNAANAANPASANNGRRRATKAAGAAPGTISRGVAPTASRAIAAMRTIRRASCVSPEPGRSLEARAPRTPESGSLCCGCLRVAAAILPPPPPPRVAAVEISPTEW
jgi:hypothetical protein